MEIGLVRSLECFVNIQVITSVPVNTLTKHLSYRGLTITVHTNANILSYNRLADRCHGLAHARCLCAFA